MPEFILRFVLKYKITEVLEYVVSLLEVLLALALGALLISAILNLAVNQSSGYKRYLSLLHDNQNLRNTVAIFHHLSGTLRNRQCPIVANLKQLLVPTVQIVQSSDPLPANIKRHILAESSVLLATQCMPYHGRPAWMQNVYYLGLDANSQQQAHSNSSTALYMKSFVIAPEQQAIPSRMLQPGVTHINYQLCAWQLQKKHHTAPPWVYICSSKFSSSQLEYATLHVQLSIANENQHAYQHAAPERLDEVNFSESFPAFPPVTSQLFSR